MSQHRLLLAIAVTAVASAAGGAAAGAAAAPTPAVTAEVRVAHLSPDTAGVDVVLDGTVALSNVAFRTVSDYATVPAGAHHVVLRAHGAPPSAKPVLEATVTLDGGEAYTIAGVGRRADLQGKVYEDDRSAPPPGEARLRVIHAAVGTPAVDVSTADAGIVFTHAGFATASPYRDVTPGRYQFDVERSGTSTKLLSSPVVALSPGVVYTIAVIGGAGTPLRLLPLTDARGAAVAPLVAPNTGAGGMAGHLPTPAPAASAPGVPAAWMAAGIAALLATCAVLARRRYALLRSR